MRHRLLFFGCLFYIFAITFQYCRTSESPTAPLDLNSVETIHFSHHVQPILSRSCAYTGCHDAATNAKGLSLSSWNDLVKGSNEGEVVIPHDSAKSLLTLLFDGTLLRKLHPSLGSLPLSSDELHFLQRWINEGAKNDAGLVPYAHSVNRLYVPNQAGDNVAIIDIDNLVVFKYVNVGTSPSIDGPHFIVANQHYWYVSLIGTEQIWKFDAHSDTLVNVARVQGSPALLALTPDGSKLYVSQFTTSSLNKIFVINTSTMTVQQSIKVWTMPHGLRMNSAGTRVYVANMMSDNISVIDAVTDSVLETVPLADDVNPFGPPKYMPMEIAISPNDSIMLVTCSETQEVRMFTTANNALVDSFHVGDQPWHLQFTPDGNFCYVTNRRGKSVSVIHIPMRHVMESIATVSPVLFDYPHGCDIAKDGRYTFVSNENSGHTFIPRYNREYVGNVCVIDNYLNQIIKVLEVGKMPTGISVDR